MFYIERCVKYAHPLNLIADINFENALTMAKKCDKIRADPEKFQSIISKCEDQGALFGIPVSLKDQIL